jgi:hypothetical protein
MKYPLSSAGYSFSASGKAITFASPIPAEIGNILHVANITRGVIYFQPQGGAQFSGSYTSPVLTFAASTTGHSDTDRLLIIYDNGQPGATAAKQDTLIGHVDGIEALLGTIDADTGSIDSKLPALQSERLPVLTTASPTDPTGNGTRAYDFTNGLRQAFTGTSTAAVALPSLGTSREVMFHASARCFVRFGDSNVTAASAAAGHMVLATEERFHLRVPVGVTHFRVIRDSIDGNLNVVAVQ